VVWLEGVAVGITEGVGEFLVGVGDVVAEGLGGEVEATVDMLVVSRQSWVRTRTVSAKGGPRWQCASSP
jgi:hypothetical protein